MQTDFCRNIDTAQVENDLSVLTHNSSIMNEDIANEKLNSEKEPSLVQMRMLRLDWVYQKGKSANIGFNKVLEILANLPREMFREQLIIVLAEHCKDEYQKSVERFGMIPFVIYLVSAQFYLNYYLTRDDVRHAVRPGHDET